MSKLLARDPTTVKPRSLTMAAYGETHVGKTFGALSFPRPLMIDTEGGCTQPQYIQLLAESGGRYLGPDDGASNFGFVLSQVEALATEEHGYETLVIDSLTNLYAVEVAREWDRKRKRGDNMSATYGAEKKPAIGMTRQLIRSLDALDMITLLICHETTAWVNGQAAGVTADIWDKLPYELDLVLHIVASGSQRIAKVEKSRLRGFAKGSGFPWSYSEFAKLNHES